MAKEWEIEGLSPDETFRQAAEKIILTKSAELWHYAPGTVAGEDIEELHSMRVASRRLRAAVDVCAPCYPPRRYARYRRQIAGLTEALGAVRDADVMLDFLRRERAQATAEELPGLDDLIAEVSARREALRPAMLAYLAELEAAGFRQRFERFIREEE
jgi:CHAD domain-containing protein